MIKKIICFIIGHEWRITHRDSGKQAALAHLDSMAGTRAICKRCCKIWDDLRPGTLNDPSYWVEVGSD